MAEHILNRPAQANAASRPAAGGKVLRLGHRLWGTREYCHRWRMAFAETFADAMSHACRTLQETAGVCFDAHSTEEQDLLA